MTVAAGAKDKRVRIWSLAEPDRDPTELIGHADVINDVTLMGDELGDLRVFTASADDTARVWDPRLGEEELAKAREILSLRQHVGDVTSVDATSDGRLLMTSGRDGNVILWPAEPPPPNLFEVQ